MFINLAPLYTFPGGLDNSFPDGIPALVISVLWQVAQTGNDPCVLRLNFEHDHQFFEGILPIQTGIRQISFFCFLFPIQKDCDNRTFFGILDDKWYDAKPQAFLQCDQPTDSAIAVLEWMDPLKFVMETDDVMERDDVQKQFITLTYANLPMGASF